MGKKKYFVLDIISLIIIIFNAMSVVAFMLPPGRAAYVTEPLMKASMMLMTYSIFGMGISGVVGVILNIISVIVKRLNQNSIKINITYLILFALTIPLSWILFQAAMSV